MGLQGGRSAGCVCAWTVAVLLTAVGLALALPTPAQATSVSTSSLTADCNANGTPDVDEPAWSSRDDDADGVCNGADVCPREANPGQDPSVCAMQAITVPADPTNLTAPHVTYSGANVTLKGIARYGGNQYMWDFGDGAPPMAWTNIVNPYDLGVQHAYSGSVGTTYTATLSVRNSATPALVASASYPIEIAAATAQVSGDSAQLDVRAQMAAEQALWYLHTHASRSTFADGAPGRAQPYESFGGSLVDQCVAADAFELHGSLPYGASFPTDPYVEDARRALALVLANEFTQPVSTQLSSLGAGNPDANGNGLGVSGANASSGLSEPTDGVCTAALADSGSPSALAPTGGANVYSQPFATVVQDAVDWLAFAQNDASYYPLGTWDFYANGNGSDTGVAQQFAELGLQAAERFGSSIPAFVRPAIGQYLISHRHTGLDFENGAWGWFGPGPGYVHTATTAAGLLGEALVGRSASHADVKAGIGFLYRAWAGLGDGSCWVANLGDTRSMYTVARALDSLGVSRIVDFNYQTGVQSSSSFDWYYTPSGQSQQGVATNLLGRQRLDGSWVDSAGCGYFDATATTAMDATILILGNHGTDQPVAHPPTVSVGGPYTTRPNSTIGLTASGFDPDGDPLTYAWDLSGTGLYADATGSAASFPVGNVPSGTTYTVCAKVTDPTSLSATACTTVTVTAPPAPPVCSIVSPHVVVSNTGGVQQVMDDGSRSSDPSNGQLTFSWSTDGPGSFTDPSAAVGTHTFGPLIGPEVSWTDTLRVSNGTLSSTCSASVSVVDDLPPRFTTTPADLVIALDAHATAAIDAWLAGATAVDVGMNAAAVVATDYTAPAGGLKAVNAQRVTWTATSVTGVTAQVSANLTVIGDSSPPVITAVPTGALGDHGWYTGDVHLDWTVADPDSAVTTSTGCESVDVTSDTSSIGTTFTCTATSSGGTATQSFTVKRDAAPPRVVVSKSPAPNAAGWNDSDVTATFACTDDGSDLAPNGCPTPTTFGEGSTPVTVSATDNAGNRTSLVVDGGKIDETPPTLSGSPTTSPNEAGWYRGDVTIRWTCADNTGGSGLTGPCPPDEILTGDGRALTASATVGDVAGNIVTATSLPIRIDRTAPVTIAEAPSGWSNSGVTVMLAATDDLSGVLETYSQIDGGLPARGASVMIADEGVHTLTFWSVDAAGNVEIHRAATVMIDKTAPTIGHTLTPSPNTAGWNNTDVSVAFQCADSLSGIASCTLAQLVSAEGSGAAVSGRAVDNAGNVADDVAHLSIDKTPPSISATSSSVANGGGWYATDVTVVFACSDALSGIAACSTPATLHEGRAQSASGTATDVAGNATRTSFGPLDIDETPPTVTYTGNAGVYDVDQTVSIRCVAADTLSGIATSTCHDLSGPAYGFGLGTYTASATAADIAGNVGSGSLVFTVRATCASLQTLIRRFVTSNGVADSLASKIEAVCSAPNANAKSGKLGAFDNEVSAQVGKSLTSDNAVLLQRLAANL